jgi:hypothetical protein
LPDDLARRFKRAVPSRERSNFIRQLLEQALPPADGDDDPLYLAALAVEQDKVSAAEMAKWEAFTIGDGLTEQSVKHRPREGGTLSGGPARGRGWCARGANALAHPSL